MTRNPAWQCMQCGSVRCDGTCPDPQEALDDVLEVGRPWAPGYCWLAQFSDVPCDGRLVRAHLIPQQLLRRECDKWRTVADDPRSWVPACGGPTGVSGHHGMLDYARTLRIPRMSLPAGLEAFAAEHFLLWYVDRTFGPTDEQKEAA